MMDGGRWMVSVTMSCDVGFWRALPSPVKPPIGQADPCAASPAQPSPRCSVYPHCQRPRRQRIKSSQLSFITPYLECALKLSAALRGGLGQPQALPSQLIPRHIEKSLASQPLSGAPIDLWTR
jgi:hypothetical protein